MNKEKQTSTTIPDTEVQESVSDDKDSKVEEFSIETDNEKNRTEDKHKRRITDYGLLVQALASIGSLLAAVVALFTLAEMRTERNNAYHPEIVILPSTFEGGKADINGQDIDKECMYIDLLNKDPMTCYSQNLENETDIYFEVPYLTLKNIGQGTAKDVSVTFSNNWARKEVDNLNRDRIGDYYTFYCSDPKYWKNNYVSINYYFTETSDNQTTQNLCTLIEEQVETINVSYITSDDDTVIVPIPPAFIQLLAIDYYYRLQGATVLLNTQPFLLLSDYIGIPALEISIHYSDMQGKKYTQEEIIPFNCKTRYKEAETIGEQLESLEIKMDIYDDYIR